MQISDAKVWQELGKAVLVNQEVPASVQVEMLAKCADQQLRAVAVKGKGWMEGGEASPLEQFRKEFDLLLNPEGSHEQVRLQ
jgi:hypothetical protein